MELVADALRCDISLSLISIESWAEQIIIPTRLSPGIWNAYFEMISEGQQ